MRLRSLLVALAAMLLLAGMFVSVHRGARGRALAEEIGSMADRWAMAEVRKSDVRREIERLRSRARIVQAAGRLGMHLPSESELVILDLAGR